MSNHQNTALTILTTATGQGEGIPTVNARDLHAGLGVKTRFIDWVKRTIKALALVEGVDFLLLKIEKQSRGGHNRLEYHLTLSAAQRIAVSGNTDVGRALWDYLKEAEEIARRESADQLKQAQRRLVARVSGKEHNGALNDAVKRVREKQGKAAAAFHFSNEAIMVDTIALGRHPKAWKAEQGIAPADTVRNHMDAATLDLVAFLERTDANILTTSANYGEFPNFAARKVALIALAGLWRLERCSAEE